MLYVICYLMQFNIYTESDQSAAEMDHNNSNPQAQIFQLISIRTNSQSKSLQYFSNAIRYLFQNPQNIQAKFARLANRWVTKHTHTLDIRLVLRMYENIEMAKNDGDLSNSILKSLSLLEEEGKLRDLLQNTGNLRFFFILTLWDKLYLYRENNLQLLKFLNLVRHLGPLKSMFTEWCEDIPNEFLKMQVQQLLVIINEQFVKLRPGVVEPSQLKIVNLNIQNICCFLQILYNSNKKAPRINSQNFQKDNLSEFFSPTDILKLHMKKINYLNFIRFPFLLNLEFKFNLLKIQSVFEQQVSMEKNIQKGLHNLISGGMLPIDENGNINLQGLAYLHFQIHRGNILDDSMEKLGNIKGNLKSPLRIEFIGEEGSDEGGVQKEYFQLLTKQIFNPYLDMFLPKSNSRVFWFNGYSFEPPIRFQFVGMLLGLSIYNSVHLDIRFPRMLYDRLIPSAEGQQKSIDKLLQGLNQIQPQIYRSLKHIMDSHEDLDPLELYFIIEMESFGEKIIQTLVPSGDKIKLSQNNKKEYIERYCDYLLDKHVEKQFRAFKKGFDRVVDTELITLFRPEELEHIICGKQVIDFKELEASTTYEGGYTRETGVVRNLWEILGSLNLQDKKGFLVFCTGSDRVPIEGLKSLKFVVQKHADSSHLPSAHTCFNVFLLPEYESKAKLRQSIQFIIKNNQGFGLI